MLTGGQCQGLHRTYHAGDVFWMCDACCKQADGEQPSTMPAAVPVTEAERQREGGNEEADTGTPADGSSNTSIQQAEATETDNSQCMSRCCSIA